MLALEPHRCTVLAKYFLSSVLKLLFSVMYIYKCIMYIYTLYIMYNVDLYIYETSVSKIVLVNPFVTQYHSYGLRLKRIFRLL